LTNGIKRRSLKATGGNLSETGSQREQDRHGTPLSARGLQDDSAGAFFVFYNSIRSFLGSTGFNQELLPALQFIANDLDLTVTPIDIGMPCVGAYGGGEQKPHV
jgi:hypothetical protein